jgi:enamine deaminase RidA (YjgF/YER057c/UK114 family)
MIIEEKIKKLGLELPEVRPMINAKSCVKAVHTGDLVFLSGVFPYYGGKYKYIGKMGSNLTPEEGYEAARFCALNLLTELRNMIGDLDKVTKVVQVTGYVNVAPEYSDEKIGYVTDGASDLLAELYGESRGRHTRTSFGVFKLARNFPVEISAIFEVKK